MVSRRRSFEPRRGAGLGHPILGAISGLISGLISGIGLVAVLGVVGIAGALQRLGQKVRGLLPSRVAAEPEPGPEPATAPEAHEPPTPESPTPDPPQPRPPLPTAVEGRLLSADGSFSLAPPPGYAVNDDWGLRNVVSLGSGGRHLSAHNLRPLITSDAEARCRIELEALQRVLKGTITALPAREVGGRAGFGGELCGGADELYVLYCVERAGRVYSLSVRTRAADREGAAADLADALGSLRWE